MKFDVLVHKKTTNIALKSKSGTYEDSVFECFTEKVYYLLQSTTLMKAITL